MQYGFFYVRSLFYCYEQTRHSSQKGNTFYKGRGQDHVCTNVVRSFRLAGYSFYSALTDLTDTDTGTNRGKTCTYSTITGLSNVQQSCHQRHLTLVL
jgi:hypothetical protein